MKALVKYAAGDGNMELRDVPEPSPGPGEVLVRVAAASICGSDLHIWRGDIGIPMRFPVIPGHEFAGVVTAVGEGVQGVRVGERVTGENTRTACGVCRQCASGSYNLCRQRLATGYAFDGAFAPYVVVPAARVHRLPDNVDFRSGALTDPSACAYHAVQELTGVSAGDFVLITGPGPMGLLSLQYAKANGGLTILLGTERDAKRLALGAELGADHILAGHKVADRVLELTKGEGVDVVLECSGAEAAAQLGLGVLRREGKFTQIGIFGRPIQFDLDQVLYKEVRLIGSFSQKYLGWERALRLCSQGEIKVAPLITHSFPLDSWEKAFSLFARGEAIKVVFEMPTERC
ncbi:MAG: zinc-binding dehydrogenase [Armatimonadetes bacterium]|nr:zinc-binding dehydrogenase [Armatimonadota bacterium]